jgi:EAL domain-containing protein (putative c-di-GMP-specific phosphodiesterase class I)
MTCQCRSGRRDFVVILPNLPDQWEQATQIADDFGWQVAPSIQALRIGLGSDQKFQDPGEVVGFLRTEFPEKTDSFRGHILSPDEAIEDNLADLIQADPIEAYDTDDAALLSLLEERRIESWFQPVYAGRRLDLWGYECLMRGCSEEGELIYPDELLETAFEQQLQFMLDRVCREEHLRNADDQLEDDARILINFLPTSIYEPEFCLRTTLQVVDELGLDRNRIVFEVVETEQVEDREHLIRIVDFYRDAGFEVALDDVGSGYSGLTMLADLSPDIIKIDRELIWKTDQSDQHRQICRSLAEMADQEDQLLLAEGVETSEQFAFLDSLSVDLYQGYLLQKPSADPSPEPDWRP